MAHPNQNIDCGNYPDLAYTQKILPNTANKICIQTMMTMMTMMTMFTMFTILFSFVFLATLVALDFTPVSKWVSDGE